MTRIGQCSLNPPAAPVTVFRGHADNQVLNLLAGMGAAKATLFAPVIFLGDQSAMPGQELLRGNDNGQFMKDPPSKLLGL